MGAVRGVEVRGFGWRHAGRKRWAVRGVDLRVERGERVLLLGASGAGKSTLLAALAGLLAEDSGEQEGRIEVDGSDPRTARERVGILFQDPESQLVMARAGDDVAFGLENRGVAAGEIWARVDQALHRVGFPTGGTGPPPPSPAVSSNDSPWPAYSRSGPDCSCSTSPPPTSTRPAPTWSGPPSVRRSTGTPP